MERVGLKWQNEVYHGHHIPDVVTNKRWVCEEGLEGFAHTQAHTGIHRHTGQNGLMANMSGHAS